MFEGMDDAALRIWEVSPNISDLGKFDVVVYIFFVSSIPSCQICRFSSSVKALTSLKILACEVRACQYREEKDLPGASTGCACASTLRVPVRLGTGRGKTL